MPVSWLHIVEGNLPSNIAVSALDPVMFLRANSARHFAAMGVLQSSSFLRSVSTTCGLASCILSSKKRLHTEIALYYLAKEIGCRSYTASYFGPAASSILSISFTDNSPDTIRDIDPQFLSIC